MNPRYLARAAPRLKFPIHLHRPFSTSPLTSADPPPPPPPPPPPQRPQPVPLPSNIARAASRVSTRDEGIALVKKMMEGIDRNDYKPVRDYDAHRASIDDVSKTQRAKGLERQMPRLSRWQVGDVYAPHDLGPVEAAKWKQRKRSQRDVFDMLGINPLHEYKNFSMMSEFMTPMGRIKHRRETGLRAVNQRKIAKAIRRAVGMGLLPSVHEHPEVLEVKARGKAMRLENGLGPKR